MAGLSVRRIAFCAAWVFCVFCPNALAHDYYAGEFTPKFGSAIRADGDLQKVWAWDAAREATLPAGRCYEDELHLVDAPARAMRTPGSLQLLATHYSNRRLIGPDFNNLRNDLATGGNQCSAAIMAANQPPDPFPGNFNFWEWIHSPYIINGGAGGIYALVHQEYHGDVVSPTTCPSSAPLGNTPRSLGCWYNVITSSTSSNNGAEYVQGTPAQSLVASIPYQYPPGRGTTEPITSDTGYQAPSNIIRTGANGVPFRPGDGSSSYYYAMMKQDSNYGSDGQGGYVSKYGTCVMRTTQLNPSTPWVGWGDGNGDGTNAFEVQFIDPYRYVPPGSPPGTPPGEPATVTEKKKHVCEPVSVPQIQLMYSSLTWNSYLNKFVLVGVNHAGGNANGSCCKDYGIYYSLSDDLIKWSQARMLLKGNPSWGQSGCTYPDRHRIQYPSLIDHDSTSDNFETADDTNLFLYFTSFHCANHERDLIRIKVALHNTARMVDFGQPTYPYPSPYGFDALDETGGSFEVQNAAVGAPGTGGVPWYGKAFCSPWNTPCSSSGNFDVLLPNGKDIQYSGWFNIPTDFFNRETQGQSTSFFLMRWDNFRLSNHDPEYKDYGGILITKKAGDSQQYNAQLARGRLGGARQVIGYPGVDTFQVPAGRWFWIWVWQYMKDTDQGSASYVWVSDGSTGNWAHFGLPLQTAYGRLIDRIGYGLIGAEGNPLRFKAGPDQSRSVFVDLASSWPR